MQTFTIKKLLSVVLVVMCLHTFFPLHAAPVRAEEKKNVLIVGDSVAAVLSWWKPSQKPFWTSQFNLILEVWGCQKLLSPGCKSGAKYGAHTLIEQHNDDNIDIVVVMTGYNDSSLLTLKEAVQKISRTVHKMGASLVWGTYREAEPVRIRARTFNEYLQTQVDVHDIDLFDWNTKSRGKKQWFRGGGVHMNAVGGTKFAKMLKNFLDEHVAKLSS